MRENGGDIDAGGGGMERSRGGVKGEEGREGATQNTDVSRRRQRSRRSTTQRTN